MNYEKRTERVIKSSINYNDYIRKRASLGWELVGEYDHSRSQYGETVLDFVRNRDLKLYDRFVDLDNKITRLQQAIKADINVKAEKLDRNRTNHSIMSFLLALFLIHLIVFDVIFLISFLVGASEYNFLDWISQFAILAILGALHALHIYLRRKLRKASSTDSIHSKYYQITSYIEKLYSEARQLDHTT